ncbi:hypothetical protein SEA_PIONEER3_15 [Microbacterium phage Pioneer3]|nr:hypothetical protein SEA_PIONEER3_15 [Microbacterium phage Pioneer3]
MMGGKIILIPTSAHECSGRNIKGEDRF